MSQKWQSPIFPEKSRLPQIWAKRAQNGLKMRFLEFWQKSKPLMCTFCLPKMKELMGLLSFCEKRFFGKNPVCPNSRPIRSLDFSKINISRTAWPFLIIFYMVMKYHERNEVMMLLVTRLPMSMSKFAWSEKVGGALGRVKLENHKNRFTILD